MLKSGAKIIPVFYYVEPSDLRYVAHGKGKYAAAFNKHEKNCRYKPEKLQEWKKVLSEVSLYSGEIIKNNGDEMRLFKNIVNIVLKEIRNVPLIVAKHPVGLNEAMKDFENTLKLVQSDQGVQIVGIWGMGGCGKTTLAKELYNKRSSSMERSCFIFDIREAKDVLQNKQIQLLKGLGVNESIDNIEHGKAILARHLRSFRVLIVMDDVDHLNQLDALLPTKDSFGKGSLIIVTTREREVLTSWGICSIYKMKALDSFNAEQLFCWNAFLQPSPLIGFEELVKKFIEACHGLPLSLKVFGGQLYGKSSKSYWESLFHKISRILSNDIKEKLKVSYDDLDNEEKEAFLDTACFFIGEKNSLAIEVWDGSGWSGLYSWERLLNKFLVEVDDNNCIRMHDHLRDLGREIANQHSPSRFWLSQHIVNSDKQIEKIKSIRGIKAAPIEIEERLLYKEEHLSGRIWSLTHSLVGLRLLVIRGDYFTQVMGEASRELVWLRWSDIGQRNLPTQLSLKNLRVLELFRSFQLEKLWEAQSNAPVQLRELIISECYGLHRFPNSIGCLNQLKKIVIKSCNIDCLPEEFCCLQLLEHLELLYCGTLSSLPNSFGDLRNLRYVDFVALWLFKMKTGFFLGVHKNRLTNQSVRRKNGETQCHSLSVNKVLTLKQRNTVPCFECEQSGSVKQCRSLTEPAEGFLRINTLFLLQKTEKKNDSSSYDEENTENSNAETGTLHYTPSKIITKRHPQSQVIGNIDADCKPVSTPMETGCKLIKSDDSPAVNQSEYRYVQGTLDYGLWYPRNNDFTLVGFTDSDWAGCLDDRKSTSGAAFFLGDCLVAWHSKKQDCVLANEFQLLFVPSQAQVADIFTKALSKEVFERYWHIGIHSSISFLTVTLDIGISQILAFHILALEFHYSGTSILGISVQYSCLIQIGSSLFTELQVQRMLFYTTKFSGDFAFNRLFKMKTGFFLGVHKNRLTNQSVRRKNGETQCHSLSVNKVLTLKQRNTVPCFECEQSGSVKQCRSLTEPAEGFLRINTLFLLQSI
ncbi:disease resistance protein Roq1-like [Cryptomeria japonica]|uniref:disease resistance protein Roq1-like n=1 Tax=Cryptomeria japonica TaxID=3369 RepID=UPI0027D9FC56|nr:disease resistance protein Roq1-like [Cryptomeria japonica]